MANKIDEFDKEKTDIAWRKLKGRLQDDKLLENSIDSGPKKRAVVIALSLVAMIAILLVMNYGIFNSTEKSVESLLVEQVNSEESSLVTTLADGSIVYLSKNGKLVYPEEFLDETRSVDLIGEAFFDVAQNSEKPFIITTAEATVEVIGTSFGITKSRDIPFMLNVGSGKVKVVDRVNNNVVYVEKGKGVTIESGQIKLFDSKDNPINEFVRMFRFKDQSLKTVVAVINSISKNEKIELDSTLDRRKLTVTFSGENIDEMAQLIGYALKLNVEKRENRIYITNR